MRLPGAGKRGAVDFARARDCIPPRQAAAALDQRVAFAHLAQIAHQGMQVGIRHLDAVAVHHRLLETRALEQAPQIAQIGEGRDARARAAFDFELGLHQRLSQLGQGLAAEQRREQQPAGLQGLAQLNERARQIVGPMQHQIAQHQVEGLGREGQRFGLAGQGRPGS